MKKIVSFIILLVFILSFPSLPGEVKAGTGENVSGYAWSETIGWISFNSLNCDPNEDGNPADGPAECVEAGRDYAINPIPNYGVNVDLGTGVFSGTSYAWSDNIGWIWFAPTDTTPDGTVNPALLNPANNEVSGWVRACAGAVNADCTGGTNPEAGDWDGWIKLRKDPADGGADYGVSLNTTPDPDEFDGWAWGSDVVGWVSFNCSNEGACLPVGSSDYKVFIVGPVNNPPYIELESQVIEYQSYCGIGPGDGAVGFRWTYRDDDGDLETQFDFRVNDVNDPNQDGPGGAEVDRSVTSLSNPDGTVNTQSVLVESSLSGDNITYNTIYYWWARVWDDQGNNSGWVADSNFTTALHAYPWPNFTCNGADDCSAVPISAEEIVTLKDISTFYGGAVFSSRLWTLPPEAKLESGFTTADSPIKVKFDEGNNLPITLDATDSDGFSCQTTENLNVSGSLPEWKEIAPTGWLSFPKFVFQNIGADKFLASILDF